MKNGALQKMIDSDFIVGYRSDRIGLLNGFQGATSECRTRVLSACHTAAVDDRAPNESINLASALQSYGFRSAVGTLWAMANKGS